MTDLRISENNSNEENVSSDQKVPAYWKHPALKHGLACLLIAVLAWVSLNLYTHQRFYTDSGIFAAVSQHLAAGKILYKEVWDHKPPMIYVINMIPYLLGEGTAVEIRLVERVFALLGSIAFYWVIFLIFQRVWLALLGAMVLLFHFFHPELLQGGNLTEEYAAWFVVAGLLFALQAIRKPVEQSYWLTLLSGFFFSCAVFTKEPFLFSSVAWFGMLAWNWEGRIKFHYPRIIAFLIGALLPLFLFLLFFLWQGNFAEWLDVVHYNFKYTANSNTPIPLLDKLALHAQWIGRMAVFQTWTWGCLFFAGCLSCLHLSFVRQHRFFPWFCLAAFGFEFYATMISGYKIPHYYLQIVYSFVLLAICGVAYLFYWLPPFRSKAVMVCGIILLFQVVADHSATLQFWHRIALPNGLVNVGPVSRMLQDERDKGATLWVNLGDNSRYYSESGLLSPVKYLYVLDHLFLDTRLSTGEEKRIRLLEDLRQHPPTYIVTSEKSIQHLNSLRLEPVVEWIQSNYEPVPFVRDRDNVLFKYQGNG